MKLEAIITMDPDLEILDDFDEDNDLEEDDSDFDSDEEDSVDDND